MVRKILYRRVGFALLCLLVLLFLGWWNWTGDPTRPQPRPGTFPVARLAKAQSSHPVILFLGDSLTSRWERTGQRLWSQYFAPFPAACLGVGEDKTENLLWRLRTEQFPGFQPTAIVILIETNNIARDHSKDIAMAINLIVDECQKKWATAHVVVIGVLPRSDRRSSLFNWQISDINSRLSHSLHKPGITFVDLTNEFADAAGYLRSEYSIDGLHLSEQGYERLAASLYPVLSNLAVPKPLITSPSPTTRNQTP